MAKTGAHEVTKAGFLEPFLAGFLTLLASLVNFLNFDRYPLLSPEVAIAVACLAALTAFMAIFYIGLRGWIQRIFDGLLIALLIDLNTAGMWLPIAAGIAFYVVGFFVGNRIHRPLAIFGGVLLLTTVIGLGGSKPWISSEISESAPKTGAANLPTVVHLVLDEHLGIEGFPDDPGGNAAANELASFYRNNNFAVFGHAYSRHMHTINAIPDMLNFGRETGATGSRGGVKVGRTKYFDELERIGYQLKIYQSDWADFCSELRPPLCLTYMSSSMQPLLAEPFSTSDKLVLIGTKFIGLSVAAEKIDNIYRRRIAGRLRSAGFAVPDTLYEQRMTAPIASVRLFEKLISDLRNAKPGTAYFAHLLLPHFPYATTKDCRVRPRNEWLRAKSLVKLEDRQAAYYQQVECVTMLVDRALKALETSDAAGNYTMIIHGDHGSRLTRLDPTFKFRKFARDVDFIASFSTLFAVRVPDGAPIYLKGPLRASAILEELAAGGFRKIPQLAPDSRPSVYLDDEDWRPRSMTALPSTFWSRDVPFEEWTTNVVPAASKP